MTALANEEINALGRIRIMRLFLHLLTLSCFNVKMMDDMMIMTNIRPTVYIKSLRQEQQTSKTKSCVEQNIILEILC